MPVCRGEQAGGQEFPLKTTKFCCPREQRTRFYSLFCKSRAKKGNFRAFTACEAVNFPSITEKFSFANLWSVLIPAFYSCALVSTRFEEKFLSSVFLKPHYLRIRGNFACTRSGTHYDVLSETRSDIDALMVDCVHLPNSQSILPHFSQFFKDNYRSFALFQSAEGSRKAPFLAQLPALVTLVGQDPEDVAAVSQKLHLVALAEGKLLVNEKVLQFLSDDPAAAGRWRFCLPRAGF